MKVLKSKNRIFLWYMSFLYKYNDNIATKVANIFLLCKKTHKKTRNSVNN
jgi:hypothetical protein